CLVSPPSLHDALPIFRRHLAVGVEYGGTAAVATDRPTRLDLVLTNPHPDPVTVQLRPLPPEGWRVELGDGGTGSAIELAAAGERSEEHTSELQSRENL